MKRFVRGRDRGLFLRYCRSIHVCQYIRFPIGITQDVYRYTTLICQDNIKINVRETDFGNMNGTGGAQCERTLVLNLWSLFIGS